MPIAILAPEVAAKIAAGEVVERPASVVKELVENGLDAGASRIAVEAEGGGVRLIRVADNGCGIAEAEAALAFARHATSKLASAADLETIATLGFRGEALPSIAAVADITMVTRPADADVGCVVRARDGSVVEVARRGAPVGTTVTVRRLFANVPARLKFLRSPQTEAGHIANLVGQYAMAYPEVAFAVRLDGREVLRSPGSGDAREALAAVLGTMGAVALLEIGGGDAGAIEVRGFVGPPSATRATRNHLSFFVNRRWVQSRSLFAAVEQAFGELLPRGRHPIGVIYVVIPSPEVDVNVHPTKREVRFRNESEVFAAVQRAVRRAVLELAPLPSVRLPEPTEPTTRPAAAYNMGLLEAEAVRPEAAAWLSSAVERSPAEGRPPLLRVVGQVQGTYIVAEGPDGMYLIDQHTAHERVLFEQLEAQRRRGDVEVQALLEPVVVDLAPAEASGPDSEALESLGFRVEPFGGRSFLLRAVPAVLKGDAAAGLRAVLDGLEAGAPATLGERLSLSLACHSAVRAGQTLSYDEMRALLRALEAAGLPRVCPHGRPIVLHLSLGQLERQFGRR